jgi:hypothetical protein
LAQEVEDLKRKNEALIGDIEILAQEMEFNLKEKEDELAHFKEKCLASEAREKRQKERLKEEIETIR